MKTTKVSATEVTRRDFLNGTLIGAGSTLLGMRSLATEKPSTPDGNADARFAPSGSAWTGYGGVGDYAWSNGNTASVMEAGHRMRDGGLDALPSESINEDYDLVVVGGGFSGFAAAYEFSKRFGNHKRCLLLDNHAIFGGEAKQNEFIVDGQHLVGPQGSSEFLVHGAANSVYGRMLRYWSKLEIPTTFRYQEWDTKTNGIKIPIGNYAPMYWDESKCSVGYFFPISGGAGRWVKNPWENQLATTPIEPKLRSELNDWYFSRRLPKLPSSGVRWLDTMTYQELLQKHLGFSAEVARFADPILAAGAFGACSDVISAYAASKLELPCTHVGPANPDIDSLTDEPFVSLPGGNTGVLRYLLKAINPSAIEGKSTFEEILSSPVQFANLDRPELPVRIRLNSTIFQVEHMGESRTAEQVRVRYVRNGKVEEVRTRTAVMATHSHVTRKIVLGLPDEHRWALAQFNHGPMLVVNVALRNWQFLARMEIAAARWFGGGFGWHASIRRTPIVGKIAERLVPSEPVVLTLYTPLLKPGYDLLTQGALGRAELLSKSYLDYEKEIKGQLTLMFRDSGFDADRDIAGIVLNRWGHAYVSPQPGFFFGTGGKPAPPEVLRQQPFHRISFGHSSFDGNQSIYAAVNEGARAAEQAFRWL